MIQEVTCKYILYLLRIMADNSSSDLVYKSFKKLDSCVLACIWSISLFSIAVLTGQYFLYKYLKPKFVEKELFLYFFGATLLFYFFIILAAFYILSKVGDNKTQESTISDSAVDTEAPEMQEEDFENTIHKKIREQNDLHETNPDIIEQHNRDIPQMCLCHLRATSRSCFNPNFPTVGNTMGEIYTNPLNTKESFKRTFKGNYKDGKHYEDMQKGIRQDVHLFIENFTEPYELRKKTIRDTESFYNQQLLRTCAKNDAINISEPKEKVQDTADCNTVKEQGTNVAETSFTLPSKNLDNHSYFNVMNHSNQRHSNGMIIPEIIIENVDGDITRSNLQPPKTFIKGKLLQPSTKKSLAAPDQTIKSATCFKYNTCRPVQMSYNIVGLPEPVKTFNEINHDRNTSNCRISSKKEITEDSSNQKHHQDKRVPQIRKICCEESREHALQQLNPINFVKITPEEILAALNLGFTKQKILII